MRLGEGAIAAVAAAMSAAMGWALHHHKKHVATLAEHEKYIRALKRRKVLALTKEHHTLLNALEKKLSHTSKLADQLDDQIKAMSNVASSLQGSVMNLTTLVEKRGKEHHELRELLQPIVTRLTLLEKGVERLERERS